MASRGKATSERKLTRRQHEVLLLASEGLTNKEIAERIGVAVRTVEVHLTAIRSRLGISRMALLVRHAIREGWLRP